MNGILRRYWPYDEVSIAKDSVSPDRFQVISPWLKFHIDISPDHIERAGTLGEKFASESITPSDAEDLNWFFTSLNKFPLAYILPRAGGFGAEKHGVISKSLDLSSPKNALLSLCAHNSALKNIANHWLPDNWTWEIDSALEFSTTPAGVDPESVFSVARRFHLLNDLENNRTEDVLDYMDELAKDPTKFKPASALIVRQNHYVTLQCNSVLSSALPIAQSAAADISEFIRAELGHDKILAKAMYSMNAEPGTVQVLDSFVVLMEVFREAARLNLLGFSMIVDIFERSSFRDEDPLATALNAGGEHVAARQVDAHREINDEGEHENVALGFLGHMAPVTSAYAFEAMRLAELATLLMHFTSAEILESLQKAE